VGWLCKHERERRSAAEQQLSDRKREAYLGLLNVYFEMMKGTKAGRPMQVDKVAQRMFDVSKELLLYGSDEVVRQYQKMLSDARSETMTLLSLGELIVALRRDMGHRRTDLTRGDRRGWAPQRQPAGAQP
jgi:hypothetical protein